MNILKMGVVVLAWALFEISGMWASQDIHAQMVRAMTLTRAGAVQPGRPAEPIATTDCDLDHRPIGLALGRPVALVPDDLQGEEGRHPAQHREAVRDDGREDPDPERHDELHPEDRPGPEDPLKPVSAGSPCRTTSRSRPA